MKTIISFISAFFIFIVSANAQVSKINLQASGLTCSMCSNAINKSLKTLSFIDNIKSNIKESEFEIQIKPNSKVDFSAVKKKVEDAGFFVAKMEAIVDLQNVNIENDAHIDFQGDVLHFMNVKPRLLNGLTQIRFLDKGYVSAKEYKKNSTMTSMNCFRSGKTILCCEGKHQKAGQTLYHVTL